MKKVRLGTFETNSSSTHSLALKNNEEELNFNFPLINKNIEITLNYDKKAKTTQEKLDFMFSFLCSQYEIVNYEILYENEIFKMWLKELKKYINFENLIITNFPNEEYKRDLGYINWKKWELGNLEKFLDYVYDITDYNPKYSSFIQFVFNPNIELKENEI